MSQAFRDLGNFRTCATPEPEEIEENIVHFERKWNELLLSKDYTETKKEIDKLKIHIRKGCLSGILPGEGTEGNEVLHHFINRCLLCGSATIGPELAIAVLTVLFYTLNSKKKQPNHERNARTNIYMPIEGKMTGTFDHAKHNKRTHGEEDYLLDKVPRDKRGVSSSSGRS